MLGPEMNDKSGVHVFLRIAPKFSGKPDGMSAESWLGIMPDYIKDYLANQPDYVIVQCLKHMLVGPARRIVGKRRYATSALLLEDIPRWFPQENFVKNILDKMAAKRVLENAKICDVGFIALSAFDKAGREDQNAAEICRQIRDKFPKVWEKLNVDPDTVTVDEFEPMLARFDRQIQEDQVHDGSMPFGLNSWESDEERKPNFKDSYTPRHCYYDDVRKGSWDYKGKKSG